VARMESKIRWRELSGMRVGLRAMVL
jgi:hypothetical protein